MTSADPLALTIHWCEECYHDNSIPSDWHTQNTADNDQVNSCCSAVSMATSESEPNWSSFSSLSERSLGTASLWGGIIKSIQLQDTSTVPIPLPMHSPLQSLLPPPAHLQGTHNTTHQGPSQTAPHIPPTVTDNRGLLAGTPAPSPCASSPLSPLLLPRFLSVGFDTIISSSLP